MRKNYFRAAVILVCSIFCGLVNAEIISDNFETGDFADIGWVTSGDSEWFVDSQIVYEGSYSARSGILQAGQQSVLEITIATSKIRFFATSSGWSGDSIKFYIDDVEYFGKNGYGDTWYGEIEHNIPHGTHTFKWVCYRGNSWTVDTHYTIDNIRFGVDLPGDGTPASPFLISDRQRLNSIGTDFMFFRDKHFRLTSDIDMTGCGNINENDPEITEQFNQIGESSNNKFRGSFDGAGHKISNLKLHKTSSRDSYMALFGFLGPEAVVTHLTVEDLDIDSGYHLGGIAVSNEGRISNCNVSGQIKAYRQYGYSAGGIAAYNTGQITTCTAMVNIDSIYGPVGGISATNTGEIKFCSSHGNIHSNTGSVSGIAGNSRSNNSRGLILSCYSSGRLSGSRAIGGISSSNAYAAIVNCSSSCQIRADNTAGGIAGQNSRGIIIRSETSGDVAVTYGYGGGLAGVNENYGVIYGCRNHADVLSLTDVIDGDYNNGTTRITGGYSLGGLVGMNRSMVKMCSSDAIVASGSYTYGLAYNISTDTGMCFYKYRDDAPQLPDTSRRLSVDAFANPASFIDAGWDFHNFWAMHEDEYGSYPGFSAGHNLVQLSRHMADIDRNGVVDIQDLTEMLSSYLLTHIDNTFNQMADFNFDGKLDLADFAVFANWYLVQDPPYSPELKAGLFSCSSEMGENNNINVGYSQGLDFEFTISNIGLADAVNDPAVPVSYYLLLADTPTADFSDPSEVTVLSQGQLDGIISINAARKVSVATDCIWGQGEYYLCFRFSSEQDNYEHNNQFGPFSVTVGSGVADIQWVYIENDGGGRVNFDDEPVSFTGYASKYEVTYAQYVKYLNEALNDGAISVDEDGLVYAETGSYNFGYKLTIVNRSWLGPIVYADGVFALEPVAGTDISTHPVVNVSWYGAMAFCEYYGYSLPDKWQWEIIASPDSSYIYGFGSGPCTVELANCAESNPLMLESDIKTTPVGYFGLCGYGLADISGNVAEWTSTR
ncbi:MAG: SUMF1/EgtB/PvdO family nonheme iron enzyme, partial [Sedimentisphaerales bacterium]|nr:SUMF1/EgtB/PvdO family nonheme iron enzyme [Sedimentisphaerales bacterium]